MLGRMVGRETDVGIEAQGLFSPREAMVIAEARRPKVRGISGVQ
jgi:hypothetical protein